MEKCHLNDPLDKSQIYKKAAVNYAVTLEKLKHRPDAIHQLEKLTKTFANEVRVYNNLGIIQKRQGETDAALESYKKALQIDSGSFFPNYNMGVLLAGERSKH
jgi:tetratricopeptide (TPR) repeat protein